MKKVRVIYETGGIARFISHLDLSRVMQYALRRSDLPVWYTEGYHQHLYLTFSNPLSLGFINKYGIMEFKLTDDGYDLSLVADRLNVCLPETIRVVDAYESERKFTEIAFSDYEITLTASDPSALDGALRKSELNAVKRGKGGEKTVNLAQYIKGLKTRINGSEMEISMRLPASTDFGINPGLVIETAKNACGVTVEHLRVTRLSLLDENGKKFR